MRAQPRPRTRQRVGQTRRSDLAPDDVEYGCHVTPRRVFLTASVVLAIVAGASTSSRAQSGLHLASDQRPTGVVEDCASQHGVGAGLREFSNRWNLVVGPLAISHAGTPPGYYSESVGGNKFPVFVKGGHRVTLELSRQTRRGAALAYGPFPRGLRDYRDARRVVTFVACGRDERSDSADGWPVSFWTGYVLAASPRCVPLLVWVDDEPRPRRVVIYLGARSCN